MNHIITITVFFIIQSFCNLILAQNQEFDLCQQKLNSIKEKGNIDVEKNYKFRNAIFSNRSFCGAYIPDSSKVKFEFNYIENSSEKGLTFQIRYKRENSLIQTDTLYVDYLKNIETVTIDSGEKYVRELFTVSGKFYEVSIKGFVMGYYKESGDGFIKSDEYGGELLEATIIDHNNTLILNISQEMEFSCLGKSNWHDLGWKDPYQDLIKDNSLDIYRFIKW